MAGAKNIRFIVSCPDYTIDGFTTREAAERRVRRLAETGTCRLDHEVIEVTWVGGEWRRVYHPVSSAARQAWIDGEDDEAVLRQIDEEAE